MRYEGVYYRGKCLGGVWGRLIKTFDLPINGKFRIIIKADGPYKIAVWHKSSCLYSIRKGGVYSGCLCRKAFQELFRFKPDGRKRYDIQIKKL